MGRAMRVPLIVLLASGLVMTAQAKTAAQLDAEVDGQFARARQIIEARISRSESQNQQVSSFNSDLKKLKEVVHDFARASSIEKTRQNRLAGLNLLGTLDQPKAMLPFLPQLKALADMTDGDIRNAAAERLMDVAQYGNAQVAAPLPTVSDSPMKSVDMSAVKKSVAGQESALDAVKSALTQACLTQTQLQAESDKVNQAIAKLEAQANDGPGRKAALEAEQKQFEDQIGGIYRKLGLDNGFSDRMVSLLRDIFTVKMDLSKVDNLRGRKPMKEDLREIANDERSYLPGQLTFDFLEADNLDDMRPPKLFFPKEVWRPEGQGRELSRFSDLAEPKFQPYFVEKVGSHTEPGFLYHLTPMGKKAVNGILEAAAPYVKDAYRDAGAQITQIALNRLPELEKMRELAILGEGQANPLNHQRMALIDRVTDLPKELAKLSEQAKATKPKLDAANAKLDRCRRIAEWVSALDLQKDPKALGELLGLEKRLAEPTAGTIPHQLAARGPVGAASH